MRDVQRENLYEVERQMSRMMDDSQTYPMVQIFGSTVPVPSTERKFGDLESVQRYLDWVFTQERLQVQFPGVKAPKAVHRKGTSSAHYVAGTVNLPSYQRDGRWAMREVVVLHELAHHLSHGDGHGARFTAVFQELLEHFIAPEAGFIFRGLAHSNGVS